MYESYWQLTSKPFENTPDPRFLYSSPQHEEGLSRLEYVVKQGKVAGMLTGVFGCGKTMLAKSLMKHLESDIYRVAYLSNPRLTDVDLLRMVLFHFGDEDPPQGKGDVLMRLERRLDQNWKDGRRSVVVVDEAHTIEDRTVFEEVRLLMNYQVEQQPLLTVLLLGQPELRNKVEENKQLSQRIAMRYHLEGLPKEESLRYIHHRLEVAGGRVETFSDEAKTMVHERSGGIPRRINQICDMSLLVGYGQTAAAVTKEVVQEAIESLEK